MTFIIFFLVVFALLLVYGICFLLCKKIERNWVRFFVLIFLGGVVFLFTKVMMIDPVIPYLATFALFSLVIFALLIHVSCSFLCKKIKKKWLRVFVFLILILTLGHALFAFIKAIEEAAQEIGDSYAKFCQEQVEREKDKKR